MRLKIDLDLTEISLKEVSQKTASVIHGLLGKNNKWHDLERKPYSCSFIRGGVKNEKTIKFNGDAHVFFNTEDEEIINQLVSNNLSFSFENPRVFDGYNLLSITNIVYNCNGKKNWVTDANKERFTKHIENKYGISCEILKIDNKINFYKNISIPVTNLLIRTNGATNVFNLFETGVGGSCGLGFGFVESVVK